MLIAVSCAPTSGAVVLMAKRYESRSWKELQGMRRPAYQRPRRIALISMQAAHFLNRHLLLAAANVGVGDVWLLLHGHHGHGGVNLGRQRDLYLVLVPVHPAPHAAQLPLSNAAPFGLCPAHPAHKHSPLRHKKPSCPCMLPARRRTSLHNTNKQHNSCPTVCCKQIWLAHQS